MVKTFVAVVQLLVARLGSGFVRMLELAGVVLIVAGVHEVAGVGAALIVAGIAVLLWSLDVDVKKPGGPA